MFKEIGVKISFLIVMILLVNTISTGACLAESSYIFRESNAESSADQFVATVNGTSVNFDWSEMVAADSYTMAVATSDANDNIDISSLTLMDMGARKIFSTTNLPSGMIFYAAILADTDQGQVVSNTVKFMPFAGTVTVPDTGAVLMQLDDPGGIGAITVSGIVNEAEETMTIRQISGDAGFGSFILTVVDDKPASYIDDDLTIYFTYAADGTVTVQSIPNRMGSLAYDPTFDESRDSLNECQQAILLECSDLAELMDAVLDRLTKIDKTLHQLAQRELHLYYYYKYHSPYYVEGAADRHFNSYKKYKDLYDINGLAAEAMGEKFKEDETKLEEEYNKCSDGPDPNSVAPVITIDTSCSIPPGAEYHERYYSDGSLNAQFYTLNGHKVGPYYAWAPKEDGSPYLSIQSCRNVDGKLIGWQIYYYMVNGSMMVAVPYENGIINGHQYEFYEDGSLHIDRTMVNDIETYRLVYNEDGSLKMWCDCAGEHVFHWTDSEFGFE